MYNVEKYKLIYYGSILKSWPDYNKSFDLDQLYKHNYEIICNQIESENGNRNDDDKKLCQSFFGFLEHINYGGGNNMYKGHSVWSDFIEWAYKKQEKPNTFTYDNLENFVNKVEGFFKKRMEPALDNTIEILNKDNVRLRNLMKLHYYLESAGDIKVLIDGNHGENYPDYCKFINDCLDIFNAYYPEVCTNTPDDTKPKNICKLLERFKDHYENIMYKALRYRQALIKDDHTDIFSNRVLCRVNKKEYSAHPIASFINAAKSANSPLFNKIMISSFSVLGFLLIFFVLIKLIIKNGHHHYHHPIIIISSLLSSHLYYHLCINFLAAQVTPLESLIFGKERSSRRRWRKGPAEEYEDEFESSDQYSYGSSDKHSYESSDQYSYESSDQYSYESSDQYLYESSDQYPYKSSDQYSYQSSNQYNSRGQDFDDYFSNAS
ncbi:variable surface protein [Plasmodium gonderi]|uniref:Variable surface protein n=1 Tax=Plasmodium gonderi TaxID=77519 RepID=A0A1Y1JBJ6_PLAGO|nr:variable surface protein [Plasmodium gonderi]GAW79048.1 variable surface protein [Plasmodium gonderi]